MNTYEQGVIDGRREERERHEEALRIIRDMAVCEEGETADERELIVEACRDVARNALSETCPKCLRTKTDWDCAEDNCPMAVSPGKGEGWREEAMGAMTDASMLLNTIKSEWLPTGDWSEWDQSVMDHISKLLREFHEDWKTKS